MGPMSIYDNLEPVTHNAFNLTPLGLASCSGMQYKHGCRVGKVQVQVGWGVGLKCGVLSAGCGVRLVGNKMQVHMPLTESAG
jgi:hypothetical protein